MRKNRDNSDYLQDIVDAIDKVETFIEGMTYHQFCDDEKTVFAVIRALEIIGEATKNIEKPLRNRYPLIPWREMAGIRDKLIHDYVGVNSEVIWHTATEDLREIRPLISGVLNENFSV